MTAANYITPHSPKAAEKGPADQKDHQTKQNKTIKAKMNGFEDLNSKKALFALSNREDVIYFLTF